MELREVMKKMEISEEYIIETAQKINSMCKLCTCGECPFYIGYGCVLVSTADIRIDEVVKKRIQNLLHHNHMEKVAEMLGVKLGEPFKIAYDNKNIISGFHLEKTGLYCDKNLRAPFNLTELLVGDAYIVKEESKNE